MATHLQKKNSTIVTQAFPQNTNPIQEASPSSTSSSPSHEFSFTVSLQPLASSSSSSSSSNSYSKPNPNHLRNTNKTTSSSHLTNPSAVDLSPADEIFFHGHLLPLHLLSHLPVSPRTSTGSLDGFGLPVKDISHEKPSINNNSSIDLKNSTTVTKNTSNIIDKADKTGVVNCEDRGIKSKAIKSFSLFNLSKWRRGFEEKDRVINEEEEEEEEEKTKAKQQQKKKLVSLDLSHTVKKYIRTLFQRRKNGTQFTRRRHTFSFTSAGPVMMDSKMNNYTTTNHCNSISRELIRGGGRKRRGEFSAPASMRTSPTNSGHLRGISSSSSNSCSTSSDSTMEELQAAIQAAIAHCKNSIAVDNDKVNQSLTDA